MGGHGLGREHGRRTMRMRMRAHGRPVHILVVIAMMQMRSAGRHGPVDHTVAGASQRIGRRHPLLLLSPIAEPHPYHLLFQLQTVRQRGDLLGGRLGLLVEVLF